MLTQKYLLIFLLIFAMILLPNITYAVDEHGLTDRVIRVGGDNNYPPYEFLDDDGNYRGFNVDIMRAVAIELGIDIELIPMSWETAIYSLKQGKICLIFLMSLL